MNYELELKKAADTIAFQELELAKLRKEINHFQRTLYEREQEVQHYLGENMKLKKAIIEYFLDVKLGD